MKLNDVLEQYGVFLHFAAQGLDSRNPGFRQVFIINGMMDEQYVFGLRDKVYRRQRGRILNGYIHGGKCYGYKNVPVEDQTRRSTANVWRNRCESISCWPCLTPALSKTRRSQSPNWQMREVFFIRSGFQKK